ncbi:hypothetical protein L0F63_006923 [Massospora cicadina]|nr:hypothetical protein L0F63_006923 [Massospora cicadina]
MEETLASLKEGFTTATAENNAVSVVQEGKEDEDVGDFGTPAELATDVEVEKLNKTMDESFKGLGEEPILPTSPLEKERFKDELSGSGACNHIESKKEATKALETTTDFGQDIFGMTEEEALAFLKEEEDAKKARASAGPPKIEIYGSSVSGNMKIKKAQNKIIDTLERFKIEYTFVDLAADDQAKLYIKRKNPNSTNIPQIYINGEFSMEFAEFEELLEYDELFEALGVEPDF